MSGEYDNAILHVAIFLALPISREYDNVNLDITTFLALPMSREYDNVILGCDSIDLGQCSGRSPGRWSGSASLCTLGYPPEHRPKLLLNLAPGSLQASCECDRPLLPVFVSFWLGFLSRSNIGHSLPRATLLPSFLPSFGLSR